MDRSVIPQGHADLIARLRAEGSALSIEAAKVIGDLDEQVYSAWENAMGEDL